MLVNPEKSVKLLVKRQQNKWNNITRTFRMFPTPCWRRSSHGCASFFLIGGGISVDVNSDCLILSYSLSEESDSLRWSLSECKCCRSPAELVLQTDDGRQQVREVLQGSSRPHERSSDGHQSDSFCECGWDDAQGQREGAGERWASHLPDSSVLPFIIHLHLLIVFLFCDGFN